MPPITGILPGKTGTFVATPLDSTGASTTLPDGVVPVWTSSDSTHAPVIVDPSNSLACSVSTLADAPQTGSFVLTISADITAPDGTVSTVTGSATVPFDANPIAAVASFGIAQTS